MSKELQRPPDGWEPIRAADGVLLCRIDVARCLLELKPHRHDVEIVDLTRYGFVQRSVLQKPDM